jgi:nucleotide-binding universal stress UspA family protein
MRILLGLDPSEASQLALQEVARRPWPSGTSIQVLTVVELYQPWTLTPIAEQATASANDLAERGADLLRSRGLKADGVVLSGDARTVILDQAATLQADLIVVGAQGVSALERFLLGSVSKAILKFAPCSVEVVRGNPNRDESPFRVLLAADGSSGSENAAKSIAGRPWLAGTEVRVLSVVELGLSALQAAFEIPAFDAAHLELQRQQAMQRAQSAIAAARGILEPTGVNVSESISVLVSSPKEIILDEASSWAADLIVLGSHGHRGIDRFLLGSVSEEVAMHAKCSVEIIRAPAQ